MLVRVTQPETPCVTLQQAKDHLRVDSDDDAADLQLKLDTAIDTIEHSMGRTFTPALWRLDCGGQWPCIADEVGYYVDIPQAPIRNVSEVTYVDKDGAQHAVAADLWFWSATPEGARVYFQSAFTRPETRGRPGDISIGFEAGYDTDATGETQRDPAFALPRQARQAILLLLGTWYANRESVVVGKTPQILPHAVELLVSQKRIYR